MGNFKYLGHINTPGTLKPEVGDSENKGTESRNKQQQMAT